MTQSHAAAGGRGCETVVASRSARRLRAQADKNILIQYMHRADVCTTGTLKHVEGRTLRTRADQFLVWYLIAHATVLFFFVLPDPALDAGTRLVLIAGLLTVLVALLRATRLGVAVDPEGVTIFNYFATHDIAWSEIVSATATPYGLRVCLADGETVMARGITRPSVDWNTKADRLADYITFEARKRTN